MQIKVLHHVSLLVSDLERSRRFYREVLGLEEIARPPFPFPGAWFRLGDRELHLIATTGAGAPVREATGTDPRRLHFAVRVASYRAALEHLREKPDRAAGALDLLWALINTREFILNH